ncbi:MAG: FG-GAP-like repeat-containing protein, partial [Candidatus Marinimicrobia bacterium]|nr:FG-GAP-like repeat-containing protein [Candidatus Neomarinimicrobiota bacterium]
MSLREIVLLFLLMGTSIAFCQEFQVSEELIVGSGPRAVNTADLNGDNQLDIIVSNGTDNTISIILSEVGSGLLISETYNTGNSPSGIACGDLDFDGDIDLAVSNQSSNSVSVFENNGDGSFLGQVVYDVGIQVQGCLMADLDQDGDLDIATVQSSSNNVSILLNQGDGIFSNAIHHPVYGSNYSIVADDLDGNGLLDIITSNGSSNYVCVLYGLGDGDFASSITMSVGDGSYNVEVGDLNQDGLPDIVTSNHRGNSFSILNNLGGQTYDPVEHFPGVESSWGVDLGDVNGDGLLDLAVVSRTMNSVSIFQNTVAGEFISGGTYDVGDDPKFVCFADINNDDHLDMVVTNEGSNSISILYQRPQVNVVVENVNARVGTSVNLPVLAEINRGRAAELNFSAYTEGLEFIGIDTIGTMIGGIDWTWAVNESGSVLQTAFAGSDEITGEGVFCYLEFLVTGAVCTTVPVNCDYALFNDVEVTDITNGSVYIEPIPDYGDVDENGFIQALDASDILLYAIDSLELDCQAWANANVYLDSVVDPLDASVILQFVVDSIDSLPAIPGVPELLAGGTLDIDETVQAEVQNTIGIPIRITNGENIFSHDFTLTFDPDVLAPRETNFIEYPENIIGFGARHRIEGNTIKLAAASGTSNMIDGLFATLNFDVIANESGQTEVILESFGLNSNLESSPVTI